MFTLDKMSNAVRSWYYGTQLPKAPGDEMFMADYKRHWSAQIAEALIIFYLRNWKFVIATGVAAAAAYAGFLQVACR